MTGASIPKKHTKPTKTSQILRLLKAQGQATNVELNRIAFRYGGRLFELRAEGHRIITVQDGVGRFRYVYQGHVDDPKDAP